MCRRVGFRSAGFHTSFAAAPLPWSESVQVPTCASALVEEREHCVEQPGGQQPAIQLEGGGRRRWSKTSATAAAVVKSCGRIISTLAVTRAPRLWTRSMHDG